MCEISSSMLLKLDPVLFFKAHTYVLNYFLLAHSPPPQKKILYKAIEDMAPTEKIKIFCPWNK